MNAGIVAALVGAVAALILAARGLRWRSVPPRQLAGMAAAWVMIIIGVVLIIRFLGLESA